MRLRRRAADTAECTRLFAVPLMAHIALVLVVAIAVAIALGFGLWWGIGHPDITSDKTWEAKDTFDFAKIVLAVVGGIGAVVALVVSYRKQRLGEAAERRQTATEAREDARLFGEDFARATDQLGSTEAPVRLAGMYTLERLGQNTLHQQQTIVNVLCAYLRMPYNPPEDDPAEEHRQENERRKHERQVRLTAQRIIATNLRPQASPKSQGWEGIHLDFTGATLLNFDFSGCQAQSAQFNGAQFSGDAMFVEAQFSGDATFKGARFSGDAVFVSTLFSESARFEGARFSESAWFEGSWFCESAMFQETQFSGDAVFVHADFRGSAVFQEVQFSGDAVFLHAKFSEITMFQEAQFSGGAMFQEAQFSGDPMFDGTRVRIDVSESALNKRAWPQGYTAVPLSYSEKPDKEGQWGSLARIDTDKNNIHSAKIIQEPT